MSYIQIGDDYDSVWGERRPNLVIVDDESGLKPLRVQVRSVHVFETVRPASGTCCMKATSLK